VFTDTLWPDVDRRHLWAAIEQYSSRERRYGAADPVEVTPPG
jgi:undecaprenyl diphosphate synthase